MINYLRIFKYRSKLNKNLETTPNCTVLCYHEDRILTKRELQGRLRSAQRIECECDPWNIQSRIFALARLERADKRFLVSVFNHECDDQQFFVSLSGSRVGYFQVRTFSAPTIMQIVLVAQDEGSHLKYCWLL